jgi:hypothetical protein
MQPPGTEAVSFDHFHLHKNGWTAIGTGDLFRARYFEQAHNQKSDHQTLR